MVSIDGTDISGATIDGTDVQEITVDGDVVWVSEIFVVPEENQDQTWSGIDSTGGDRDDPLRIEEIPNLADIGSGNSSSFDVSISVTQNGSHAGDESVECVLGVRVEDDSSGDLLQYIETAVTFGGGTDSGTTRTSSTSGSFDATSDDETTWYFYWYNNAAPTTSFSPNNSDLTGTVEI